MIPSFVITGFLGSGKTTLLIEAAKTHFKGKRVAVVVNEFGEVGVDGRVLENAYSKVMELPEGCICCTLHAEFERGIEEIREEYDPEVILVETSGASEPFPVILSLQSLGCFVEGVVCVVDSKNFPKYRENETARYQIGGSTTVVLNKADLVSGDELDLLERDVREIWERHRLRNLFTGEEVFKGVRIYRAVYGKVPGEVFGGAYTLGELKGIGLGEHKDRFSSEVVYLDEPVGYEELKGMLENLGNGILRAKGIVRFRGEGKPMLVNWTFGLLDVGGEVENYFGRSFLVLIGEKWKS